MQCTIRTKSWLVPLVLSASGFFCAIAARAADAPNLPPKVGKSETIKLFNGKNLDGWHGHEQNWSVQDGAIVGKNA
jgi:hypothetical protein